MSHLPDPNPPTDAGVPGTAFADRVIGGSKGYANKQATALLNALRYQGVEITQALEDAITAVGSEFYGASDPALDPDLTVTAGSVWADSGTGLVKRRNDTNDDWVVEGTLYQNHLPEYAVAPNVNVGPIYLHGDGPAEWDNVTSTYVPIGGGAKGGGANKVFWVNDAVITEDFTVKNGTRAGSFGPLELANGAVVEVEPGGVWTIV